MPSLRKMRKFTKQKVATTLLQHFIKNKNPLYHPQQAHLSKQEEVKIAAEREEIKRAKALKASQPQTEAITAGGQEAIK